MIVFFQDFLVVVSPAVKKTTASLCDDRLLLVLLRHGLG
jgi:hypothetical protein